MPVGIPVPVIVMPGTTPSVLPVPVIETTAEPVVVAPLPKEPPVMVWPVLDVSALELSVTWLYPSTERILTPVAAKLPPLETVMPGDRPTVVRPVTTGEPVVKAALPQPGRPEAA